ncbi:D-hexose-6-phosphate mutarotase [Pseudomonas sp. LRF_L74]|uniref:D-hexose-6-phosphate mutarotase n=1 Tax=Pseudomonas sp. LRF_L74 TaxID=3369422 RepID=UPI003F612191
MNTESRQPQVERVELGELVCWRVQRGDTELLVAQQGAQVLRYQRAGEPPLIWLSEEAIYARGQSVRGGVPVCWPWFGDLKRNPQAVQAMHAAVEAAPAHGGVRNLDWQLHGVDSRADGVKLSFLFDNLETPLPGWPHDVELQLDIRLDEHLHLSLTSRNLGAQPVVLSQALHTYFAVSDIHAVSVSGLHGTRYIETLDDWQERRQDGAVHFAGETDRIYLDTPSRLSIHDRDWQRTLHLDASGSRSAVVWNPWVDKAKRLSAFADDAWQRMLCIETANVWDDCISLAPGQRHTLELTLSSERA